MDIDTVLPYLTHKAEMLDHHPQVILAGCRINDGMGKYIAERTIKTMIGADQRIGWSMGHRRWSISSPPRNALVAVKAS